MPFLDAYENGRATLAAQHDPGANEALHRAVEMTLDLEGYAHLKTHETLAELAALGWRPVRDTSANDCSKPSDATSDCASTVESMSVCPSTYLTTSASASTYAGPTLPDDYWK